LVAVDPDCFGFDEDFWNALAAGLTSPVFLADCVPEGLVDFFAFFEGSGGCSDSEFTLSYSE
jgi:hypothetical protein